MVGMDNSFGRLTHSMLYFTVKCTLKHDHVLVMNSGFWVWSREIEYNFE